MKKINRYLHLNNPIAKKIHPLPIVRGRPKRGFLVKIPRALVASSAPGDIEKGPKGREAFSNFRIVKDESSHEDTYYLLLLESAASEPRRHMPERARVCEKRRFLV